jgi:hypothetical protein
MRDNDDNEALLPNAAAGPTGEGELLPCPHCGRESKVEDFFIDDDPTPWYVATCEICPVKTYDQTTAAEAARIWNTRVSLPDSEGRQRLVQRATDWLDEYDSVMKEDHNGAIKKQLDKMYGNTQLLIADLLNQIAPKEQ